MPTSRSQETILAAFNEASGGRAGGQSATAEHSLIDALTQATQVINAQTQATAANTDAIGQSSQAKGSSAGKDVSDVLSTASQFLGGGLSLMPLVSLFSSLFGGGQSQQPATLVPFSLPPSLNMESTNNNQDVVWGENGLPRSAANSGSNAAQQMNTQQMNTQQMNAPHQITVQVQAMDSQSFLDHSDDIAQAVRQAMLNMNSINDVVTNL